MVLWAGTAEFSLRYPSLSREMVRRRILEENLSRMSTAALQKELRGTANALARNNNSPRDNFRSSRQVTSRQNQNHIDLDGHAADYGWVDPPPSCVFCCGPFLACCNRHPRQKRAFVTEQARLERERTNIGPPARGCCSSLSMICCLRRVGQRSSIPQHSMPDKSDVTSDIDVAALYAEVETGGTEHAALRCGPRHALSLRAIIVHVAILAWLAFVMFFFIIWTSYATDNVAASLLQSWATNLAISLFLVEVNSIMVSLLCVTTCQVWCCVSIVFLVRVLHQQFHVKGLTMKAGHTCMRCMKNVLASLFFVLL